MLKKEARRMYRKKRDELTPMQRMKLDDLLLIQFQKLPLPPLAHILSFYPMEGKNEINTFILSDFLAFVHPGLQIAYPKTDVASHTMQALLPNGDADFEENEYGILEPRGGTVVEPDLIDLVLVPMLAFDSKGHRAGYGKGFYDRFLAECPDHCIKAGLCYFDAVDVIDDASEYDVPLTYCITPHRLYVF